jgi:hypothetical protein
LYGELWNAGGCIGTVVNDTTSDLIRKNVEIKENRMKKNL